MQFQIPQFIETEDKVVGPLSLRQFFYAGGALGATMMLYFIVDFIVWLPLAVIFLVIGVGFAFVKVNGRPLTVIFIAAARYFWQPRTYVWKQTQKITVEKEDLPKTPNTFSIEKIAQGFALSNIWQKVQTGTTASNEASKRSVNRLKERYQVFSKLTGERTAAKRIDYR